MAYDIESGIAPPNRESIPFDRMEVGQSVVFDLAKRRSIATMASRYKRLHGKTFMLRKVSPTEGRLFRIA